MPLHHRKAPSLDRDQAVVSGAGVQHHALLPVGDEGFQVTGVWRGTGRGHNHHKTGVAQGQKAWLPWM